MDNTECAVCEELDELCEGCEAKAEEANYAWAVELLGESRREQEAYWEERTNTEVLGL